jgi:hypothetical protein
MGVLVWCGYTCNLSYLGSTGGRTEEQGQPKTKSKILSEKYFKKNWDVVPVVELLLRKCEVLSSYHTAAKKKTKIFFLISCLRRFIYIPWE